jgi:hypothetical protein
MVTLNAIRIKYFYIPFPGMLKGYFKGFLMGNFAK